MSLRTTPTVVWADELPPPFVCVICERLVEPNPWHFAREHKPPICRYCSNHMGHQVRIPGMTRGDHHTMQRLHAVTEGLIGAAGWREYGQRFGTV